MEGGSKGNIENEDDDNRKSEDENSEEWREKQTPSPITITLPSPTLISLPSISPTCPVTPTATPFPTCLPSTSSMWEPASSAPTTSKKSVSSASTTSRKLATKRVPQETASSKLMAYLIDKNSETQEPQHPVDAFLAGIATTLKLLTPYYLNLAKSEIFTTAQKYEMKMLMEKHPNTGATDSDCISSILLDSDHTNNNKTSLSSTTPMSPVAIYQDEIRSTSATQPNDTALQDYFKSIQNL